MAAVAGNRTRSAVQPGEATQQAPVRRRSHYPQAGLALNEWGRGRQATLHGHESVTLPIERILEQLAVFQADHAKAPVLQGCTWCRWLFTLGLDQPGVEYVGHPLGVSGVG